MLTALVSFSFKSDFSFKTSDDTDLLNDGLDLIYIPHLLLKGYSFSLSGFNRKYFRQIE